MHEGEEPLQQDDAYAFFAQFGFNGHSWKKLFCMSYKLGFPTDETHECLVGLADELKCPGAGQDKDKVSLAKFENLEVTFESLITTMKVCAGESSHGGCGGMEAPVVIG